ncbi:DUF2513 domain-containing protein [Bradyrhizobium sp. Arg68]|uniref:DUF2513 domain-containing protein n=1 Tax=Bradyrhizobium ivorense TaxID=2511166 RepID=UPI003557A1E3|nr:DUF2513 domain-containing protein [Bradyrhizobium ivorense]
MTASGHAFLDAVQNPEVWSKTKAAAKKVGVSDPTSYFKLPKQKQNGLQPRNWACLSNW